MSIDLPGFAEPVADAQAVFRAVLDAMARPGTIRDVGARPGAPAPLGMAMAAVLLTLADAETPVWLAPSFAGAGDWVRFHCGARVVGDAAEAVFVAAQGLPDLGGLACGTDEEPQGSATVLLQVPDLRGGARLVVSGPGLAAPAAVVTTIP